MLTLTRRARSTALVLLVFLVAPAAFGHGKSVSYSTWEIDGAEATVSVRLKLLELSRIGPEALPPGSVSVGPGSDGAVVHPAPGYGRCSRDGVGCTGCRRGGA